MKFLAQNWFYILVLVLFVALHLIGPVCGPSHHKVQTHAKSDRPDDPSHAGGGFHPH